MQPPWPNKSRKGETEAQINLKESRTEAAPPPWPDSHCAMPPARGSPEQETEEKTRRLGLISASKVLVPVSESILSLSLKLLPYLDPRKGLGSSVSEITVGNQSIGIRLRIRDCSVYVSIPLRMGNTDSRAIGCGDRLDIIWTVGF